MKKLAIYIFLINGNDFKMCFVLDVYFVEGFYGESQVHSVPEAQKVSVGDDDYGLGIACHHFFVKRQKAVPGIAPAFSVREQSVIDRLFRTL